MGMALVVMPPISHTTLPVASVVGLHLAGGVDHHLLPAVDLDDVGRRPRGRLVARRPPALGAGPGVEADDEVLALVVPVDHQGVAGEGRRGALAEAVARRHVAEVALPERLALAVQAVDPARAEVRPDPLAVGNRRGRRPGAVGVGALVRLGLEHRALPDRLAGGAVERQDDEAHLAVGSHAALAALARRGAGSGRPGCRRRPNGGRLGVDRRQQIDAVAPDHRRGMAAARDRHLVADVRRLAPGRRRVAMGSDTVAPRAAPLRPVALRHIFGRHGGAEREKGEKGEGAGPDRGVHERCLYREIRPEGRPDGRFPVPSTAVLTLTAPWPAPTLGAF